MKPKPIGTRYVYPPMTVQPIVAETPLSDVPIAFSTEGRTREKPAGPLVTITVQAAEPSLRTSGGGGTLDGGRRVLLTVISTDPLEYRLELLPPIQAGRTTTIQGQGGAGPAPRSQKAVLSGYVGVPFLDHGRTRRGCDCWGLVRLVHQERFGIDLPLYGETSATELLAVARHIRAAVRSRDWIDVSAAPRRAGDVVLMKRALVDGPAWHLGIMRDDRHVLHTEEGVDSHYVPLDDVSLRHRIVGFRRHRRLM